MTIVRADDGTATLGRSVHGGVVVRKSLLRVLVSESTCIGHLAQRG